MRFKTILITIILTQLFVACCGQKNLMLSNGPHDYKIVRSYRIKRIAHKDTLANTSYIYRQVPLSKSHFIYQNFQTYYRFQNDKEVLRFEVLDGETVNLDLLKPVAIGENGSCRLSFVSEQRYFKVLREHPDSLTLHNTDKNTWHVLSKIH